MYKIIDNQVLYKLNYKLIYQIHDGKSFQGLHILFLHWNDWIQINDKLFLWICLSSLTNWKINSVKLVNLNANLAWIRESEIEIVERRWNNVKWFDKMSIEVAHFSSDCRENKPSFLPVINKFSSTICC